MEFKGDEFLKNLVLEQEKAELETRAKNLESQKNASIIKDGFNNNSFQAHSNDNFNDNPVIVDIKDSFDDELNDIKLTNNSMNSETKKKYIILSISLSILFILTIVIIRLISDDSKDNSLFTTPITEQIQQDNILDAPDANEKYDALIKQKAKQTIQKELNLKSISKEEIPLPKVEENKISLEQGNRKQLKESTNDVFGMEEKAIEKEKIKVKEIVKEVIAIKKPIPAPTKKEIVEIIEQQKIPKVIQPTKLVGNFIQIGAFTQTPNKILLKKVEEAGYVYKIHKMTIKGTIYNKVLIGPYKGEIASENARNKIRKDLNKPKAYILRLK